MAIKRSASAEIERLAADLPAADDVKRQAAIARLTVIGPRAVGRLVELAHAGPARGRVAALIALEAIGDPRAISPAVAALAADDDELALAAVGVARRFLRGDQGAAVLDPLAAVVLDPSRSSRVRLAGYEALSDLPAATIAPLVARLRADSDPSLRQAVNGSRRRTLTDPAGDIDRAAHGRLPEEPEELVALLEGSGPQIPLSTLHRLVTSIREREAREVSAGRRRRWLAARGATHRALAARKSRVALYDLRETLDQADRDLPRTFTDALSTVGDASCLEPLVDAYVRLRAAGSLPSSDLPAALGAAFRAIVRRERIGSRHTAIVRVRARWPDALAELRGRGTGRAPRARRL